MDPVSALDFEKAGGLVVAIAIHAATTAFDEFYIATGILSPRN